MKKHFRWKSNVIFKIHIDTASVGQCWRLRTSAETSPPQPIETLNVPVTVKLGKSDTYVGTVTIRRIKERVWPDDHPTPEQAGEGKKT